MTRLLTTADYIATPKLRWVVNHQKHRRGAVLDESQDQLVLQQWWQHPAPLVCDGQEISVGEWRDVSLCDETES